MPTDVLTTIFCKGTLPGTNQPCRNEIAETDGRQFFWRSSNGQTFVLELDPPRIRCSRCGFKTRLQYSEKLTPKRG